MREDGEPVETPLRIDWSNALLGAMQSYADALIEIAADFVQDRFGFRTWCGHCYASVEDGCSTPCAGLKARRALGIA